MPKPVASTGEKNLIGKKLFELRKEHNMSQRDLARIMQLAGYDVDKNVILRIENNTRYVSDIELQAIHDIFKVSYDFLLEDQE